MKIGVVKEIKDRENRVSVTPDGVFNLVGEGHSVLVETGAGLGSGFTDQEYENVGGIVTSTDDVWSVDLVVKVKEPLASEYHYLQEQMIFTFFHLTGVDPGLTTALLASKTTAIAYETLEDEHRRLPVLAPMSAVAGNMATLMGSYYLAKFNQGKGMQLGKVLGKKYGKVVIIGNGVVGQHAAHVACSMGANVYIAAINQEKMQYIKESFLPEVNFFVSNQENLKQQITDADLVIGAVLRRGEKAPYVLTEDMVRQLAAGTVVVDVSIDQGGCIETSRPTSHSDPVFIKYDIVHYCVTNMPGAYPRTSTMALAEATSPYLLKLANQGLDCFKHDAGMAKAVNTFSGYITYKPVAEDMGLMQKYSKLESLL